MRARTSRLMRKTAASGRRPGAAAYFVVVVVVGTAASARSPEMGSRIGPSGASTHRSGSGGLERARGETLWIFDADFEDLAGDNAGWRSRDMSGRPPCANYWHHDTIRLTEEYLGDSTWWCGKVDETGCWRQPRGYGNYWTCLLERDFPLSEWSEPGDIVELEWDQRYAMERNYDYGYVDVSDDDGATWSTIAAYNNTGFQGAGIPANWDNPWAGHPVHDLGYFYPGVDVRVRFRFESDIAYSPQDQYDNPQHSCKDGAWQLDNITISVNGDAFFYDDSESGNMGWIHEDCLGINQTEVVFRRVYDPETLRGLRCDARSSWVMAATDTATGRMVNGQDSWLVSPPIDVSGASKLVTAADLWLDVPEPSGDRCYLWGHSSDDTVCLRVRPGWPSYNEPSGGPAWGRYTMRLDELVEEGQDWITVGLKVASGSDVLPEEHMAGAFLDRLRVGAIVGSNHPTVWYTEDNHLFLDRFHLSGALTDQAGVCIFDDDGCASASLVASYDLGATWHESPAAFDEYWRCYEQVWSELRIEAESQNDFLQPAVEILYYLTLTDSSGHTSVIPEEAPSEPFRVSILPVHGSIEDPGILLVRKRGQLARSPGDDRVYRRVATGRIREALDILGYEYDTYHVRESWDMTPPQEGYVFLGPEDPLAYEVYDTHVWSGGILYQEDQQRLTNWLAGSTPEAPRCLLMSGNETAWDLIEEGGELNGFLANAFGASYERRHPGSCPDADAPDTLVRLLDAGNGFLTYDDRECWIQCGCPEIQCVNVVGTAPGSGTQTILKYDNGRETFPAGVARVDSITGAKTVFLPFRIGLMSDGLDGVTGHYRNGIHDRVDLIGNIMEFFEKEPTGTATTAPDAAAFTTSLGRVRPNPFNPVATIAYSVAERGRVEVRVYNLAGRVVTTLVDAERKAGRHEVSWDGTTASGDRASSGVYFVRMEAGNYRASEKLVLLK